MAGMARATPRTARGTSATWTWRRSGSHCSRISGGSCWRFPSPRCCKVCARRRARGASPASAPCMVHARVPTAQVALHLHGPGANWCWHMAL